MGRNNYFQFKKFKIIQEKSAMKVGTDGALLGAWANVAEADTILDVGAGTGLIALMLAQRSSAKITGIEIENNAAEEANSNVQRSPWKDRVSIINSSFQEFAKGTGNTFDLIVSNPPFFTNSYKSEVKNRSIARHNDLLPFSELISGALNLLSGNGRLAVILPHVASAEFIDLAVQKGLNLQRYTEVKPSAVKESNRVLMELTKKQTTLKKDSLIIYSNDGSDYTEMYKELTRDFYLKF
jgi:tRNA1Val (adenine37-N6)-methyltransferase